MDEERQIRFLVAPTLFLASVLLGALSDPATRDFVRQTLLDADWSKVIGLVAGAIAGGGVVVFAAGYVFGTSTIFFLRLFFRWRPQALGKITISRSGVD
jgi:hypothetical protein